MDKISFKTDDGVEEFYVIDETRINNIQTKFLPEALKYYKPPVQTTTTTTAKKASSTKSTGTRKVSTTKMSTTKKR